MKYFVGYAIVVVVAVVIATASAEADAGFFIPKAFYTLDAEGHKTQPHPVSPHTAQYLRRLRRQAYSSSSSSSSASSSSNGGPVYFSTQNTVSHSPAGTVSFASRFGDDGSSTSTSAHSSSGVSVGGSAGVATSIGVGGGYGNGYGNSYGNGYGNGYGNDYDDGQYHGNNNAGHNVGANSGHVGFSDTPVQFANRFGGSSASSVSSVSSNGGPVYFKTEQSVSHPTSGVNFASRFGDDSPSGTVSKTVSTSGYIDEKGVVHSKTTTTKH